MPPKKNKKNKTPKKGSSKQVQLNIGDMLDASRDTQDEDSGQTDVDEDADESVTLEQNLVGASSTPGLFITKANLEQIITKSVKQAVSVAMEKLTENIHTIVNEKLEKYESDIFDLQNDKDQLRTQLTLTEKELEETKSKLTNVQTTLSETQKGLISAQNAINQLEQYSRKSCVRVFGVPEQEQENCKETIVNIARSKLSIDLTAEMIDACHRIGKKRSNKTRSKRPIIVRLLTREAKEKLMKNKLKLKSTGMSIFEDLTYTNHQLLMKAKDNPLLKDAWFVNGKIIGLSHGGKKFQIQPDTDIRKAIAN